VGSSRPHSGRCGGTPQLLCHSRWNSNICE
jgi:hypothetical protein